MDHSDLYSHFNQTHTRRQNADYVKRYYTKDRKHAWGGPQKWAIICYFECQYFLSTADNLQTFVCLRQFNLCSDVDVYSRRRDDSQRWLR